MKSAFDRLKIELIANKSSLEMVVGDNAQANVKVLNQPCVLFGCEKFAQFLLKLEPFCCIENGIIKQYKLTADSLREIKIKVPKAEIRGLTKKAPRQSPILSCI